jgi:methyl-accepting chemotaxis protein
MDQELSSNANIEVDFPRFRRRNFLVDKKSQLIPTLKVTGVVVALLILVNLIFSWWNALETAEIIAASPQLADQMRTTDVRSAMLLLAISLVCVGLVVYRSIILTHRTAGASYKIGMRLDQIAAGQYDTELHLRLKDNLRDLEEPFNKMSASLRRIAQDDAEALTTIADEIQGQENAALVEKLRKLAEAKSSLTG